MDLVIDVTSMTPYTAPFSLVWHLGLKDGFYYWKENALMSEIENDTYWYPDHLPFK